MILRSVFFKTVIIRDSEESMYSNKAWYILDSKKTFVLTIRDEIILRNS